MFNVLEPQQAQVLKTLILSAFNKQRRTTYTHDEFEIAVDVPNTQTAFSLVLTSKRTDDHLRLRVYGRLGSFNEIGPFVFRQKQGYGTGYDDDVHVATGIISKADARQLAVYVNSAAFRAELTSKDFLLLEDDGKIILEDGTGFLRAEL